MRHVIPSTIPFVGTGIPVVGDPLNAVLDPFFSLPFVFFGANVAIRVAIFINAFLSGLGMFFLLKSIKVSKFLQFAGSFLYMSSGSFVSSVAAGHITEKFLVYPVIPIFFMMILRKKLSVKTIFGAGVALGATLYCGDIYAAWFLTLFLVVVRAYYFVVAKGKLREVFVTCCIGFIALLVASPKLFYFFSDVVPILKRTNIVNPFLGSIQFFLFPFQFLMPLQVNFYDRPFFQRHLGFYYNWYEYYAFIGLLPVIFLRNIKPLIKNDLVRICVLLLIVGALYVSNAYWYSPFHYLFLFVKPLDVFRVPQRIGIPLSSIVIVLLCLCANTWKNKKTLYLLWLGGLVWTYAVAWFTFSYTFVPIPKDQLHLASYVQQINAKKVPVINIDAIPEYLLATSNMPVINYYYGWVPKNTPDIFGDNAVIRMSEIAKTHALYILSSNKYDFEQLGYKKIQVSPNKIVWEKL